MLGDMHAFFHGILLTSRRHTLPDAIPDTHRFGWLVGSMVYHGDLVLPSNTSTAAGSTTAALQSSDLTQGSQQQLQQQPSLHLSGEGLLKGVTLLPLLDPAAVAPTPPGECDVVDAVYV
jgi:hypothetical protein